MGLLKERKLGDGKKYFSEVCNGKDTQFVFGFGDKKPNRSFRKIVSELCKEGNNCSCNIQAGYSN